MRAILVRIGIDHSFGGWNAPVDPKTGRFAYVPIPESAKTRFQPKCRRAYPEVIPALEMFCNGCKIKYGHDLELPDAIADASMHLDPDFEHLTYGDDGAKRGAQIKMLSKGDLLVFYAGLRPIFDCGQKLIYGLVGLYVVKEVVSILEVPNTRWHENAHTRKAEHWNDDIVVRANAAPLADANDVFQLAITEIKRTALRPRSKEPPPRGINFSFRQLSFRDIQPPRREMVVKVEPHGEASSARLAI